MILRLILLQYCRAFSQLPLHVDWKRHLLLVHSVFYPPCLVRDEEWNIYGKKGWLFILKRIGLDRKRILNVATVVHEQRKKIRRK